MYCCVAGTRSQHTAGQHMILPQLLLRASYFDYTFAALRNCFNLPVKTLNKI